MPDIVAHGTPNHPHYFIADLFLAQKLDVFFPGQRNQNTHSSRGTFLQKPIRRRMIDAQNVQPDLAHHAKIDIHLFGPAESVPLRVRLERAVSRAFDEKLPIAFEAELRNVANPCHVKREANSFPYRFSKTSRTTSAVCSMSFGVCAVEIKPVSNWDGAK